MRSSSSAVWVAIVCLGAVTILGPVGCGGKVAGGGTGGSSGGAGGGASGSGSGGASSGGNGGGAGSSGSSGSDGGGVGSSGVGGSGSSGAPEGCETANLPGCAGSQGYLCFGGASPEIADPSLTCSAPGPTEGGQTPYCCVSISTGSDCMPDAAVGAQCSDPGSYGYQCDPGDDPTEYDPSLVCSAPVADPSGKSDFCCAEGSGGSSSGAGSSSGGVPAGCTVDDTVACSGPGATGYACTPGENPELDSSSLACTTPVADASGDDDYCCVEWSYGTSVCTPDDTLTACPDPGSYGFQCELGNDPTMLSAQLTCSTPTSDPDGIHDDFCCVE